MCHAYWKIYSRQESEDFIYIQTPMYIFTPNDFSRTHQFRESFQVTHVPGFRFNIRKPPSIIGSFDDAELYSSDGGAGTSPPRNPLFTYQEAVYLENSWGKQLDLGCNKREKNF